MLIYASYKKNNTTRRRVPPAHKQVLQILLGLDHTCNVPLKWMPSILESVENCLGDGGCL